MLKSGDRPGAIRRRRWQIHAKAAVQRCGNWRTHGRQEWTKNDTVPYTVTRSLPKLTVRFYREASGTEPVRDRLKALPAEERSEVGIDIKTVQLGWPLGMPVVDHVDREIWEVRTRLANRLARVLFVLEGSEMVLLHGFIKKERTTPKPDLDLARQRLKKLRSSS
jgi:phage-related protein